MIVTVPSRRHHQHDGCDCGVGDRTDWQLHVARDAAELTINIDNVGPTKTGLYRLFMRWPSSSHKKRHHQNVPSAATDATGRENAAGRTRRGTHCAPTTSRADGDPARRGRARDAAAEHFLIRGRERERRRRVQSHVEKAPKARERRRPSIVGSVASGNGATAATSAQPAKAAATPRHTGDCEFRFVFGDDA